MNLQGTIKSVIRAGEQSGYVAECLEIAVVTEIGLTILSWWKRFGHGTLPDSLNELARAMEPLAQRFAA